MRTIKFRVWDTREKEMVIDKNQQFDDLIIFREGELIISDRFKLMQFTGLLDKNGKEIYEGDILKSGNLLIKVVFEDGKFRIYCINCHDSTGTDLIYYNGKGEIIGNIYESPDLINGDKE